MAMCDMAMVARATEIKNNKNWINNSSNFVEHCKRQIKWDLSWYLGLNPTEEEKDNFVKEWEEAMNKA